VYLPSIVIIKKCADKGIIEAELRTKPRPTLDGIMIPVANLA
jgi:hypothetical protein